MTNRDDLINFLNAHMADPKYVGLKPNPKFWPLAELQKAVDDIKGITGGDVFGAAAKLAIVWPQMLKIYVHDQKDECEDMADWLKARGIDRDSEAGRLMSNTAYEHEMIYRVWPNGKALLVSVDGCAVEKPANWKDPE